MTHDDVQNRMADAPDLVPLRGTSKRPSLLGRTVRRVSTPRFSSNVVTVILALTIVLALAVAIWVVG